MTHMNGRGEFRIQDLSMDPENLHLVWGDSRAGFQGLWYGRLPLRSD